MDYRSVSTGYVTLETQTSGNPDRREPRRWESRPCEPGPSPHPARRLRSRRQARDGTLLAVVPIPGTRTSLAIVGYAIATSAGQAEDAHGRATQPAPCRLPGCSWTTCSAGSGPTVHEIPLTFQEFELLAFLSAHPVTVFSRADLIEQVWRRNPGRDRRAVRAGQPDRRRARQPGPAQARPAVRPVPGHRIPGWLPVPAAAAA